MTTSGLPEHVRALRDTAAITFLGFLVGLAYQEAVGPASTALQKGLTATDAAIFVAFFLLGLTTFLFGSYYLASSQHAGVAWLANFATLAVEGVILIFMAEVASGDATHAAKYGFAAFLAVYLVIDALWNIVTVCAAPSSAFAKAIPYAAISAVAMIAALVIIAVASGTAESVAASVLIMVTSVVQMIVLVRQELV